MLSFFRFEMEHLKVMKFPFRFTLQCSPWIYVIFWLICGLAFISFNSPDKNSTSVKCSLHRCAENDHRENYMAMIGLVLILCTITEMGLELGMLRLGEGEDKLNPLSIDDNEASHLPRGAMVIFNV